MSVHIALISFSLHCTDVLSISSGIVLTILFHIFSDSFKMEFSPSFGLYILFHLTWPEVEIDLDLDQCVSI